MNNVRTTLPGLTIVDIARETGVSKSTVSRVISGHKAVAPATRATVLQVMERLGYRVNSAARSLRTRRSALVGLLGGRYLSPNSSRSDRSDR